MATSSNSDCTAGNCTAARSGKHPMPTVAFALCGAMNGLRTFDNFLTHVVQPYGASDASALFALLKPIEFDGSWYDARARRTVEQWFSRTHSGLPMNGTQIVLEEDAPLLRHREQAIKIVRCLWPDLKLAADQGKKRGVSPRVWKIPASVTRPAGLESRWMRCTATESWPRLEVSTKSPLGWIATRPHLYLKQDGSAFGQPALRRLPSAPDHASGCPKLRPASANPPHWPRWPAVQAVVSTRGRTC